MTPQTSLLKKRLKILSASVIGAVSLSLAIYLWLTPIDVTRLAPLISSFVSERTGRAISFDSAVARLLPYPDLTVKGLVISDRNGVFGRFGAVRVRSSYLPLLMGKVRVDDLETVGAQVFLKRYPDGATNIDDLIGARTEARPAGGLMLDVKSARMESGTLFFTDLSTRGGPSFELAGLRGKMTSSGAGSNLALEGMLVPGAKLTLNGSINRDGINGTGSITGLDLGRFRPYAEGISKGASISGKASARLSFAYGKDRELLAEVDYRGLLLDLPGVSGKPIGSGRGSFVIKASGLKDNAVFEIQDARLFFHDFSVTGDISATAATGDKLIRAHLSATPVHLLSLIDLMPKASFAKISARRITDLTPLGGTIAIDWLDLDARLSELKRSLPSAADKIALKARLNNLSFRLTGLEDPVTDLDASVAMKNGNITVKGLSARYGRNSLRSTTAEIRDISGEQAYDVTVKGTLEAGSMLRIARGVFARENPTFVEKLSKANVSGSMDLDIKASGDLKHRMPQQYSGNVFINDASLSHEHLPVSIESLSADAAFDKKKIEVKGLRASDGRSYLVANGSIHDYTEKDPSFSVAAETRLYPETVSAIARSTPKAQGLYTDGSALVRLKADGSGKSISASVLADATGAWIAYRDYVKKEEDYPAYVEALLERSDGEVRLKKAIVRIGSSAVEISGRVDMDAGSYALRTRSPELFLDDLDSVSPYLRSEYRSSGLISFDLGASKDNNEADPAFNGTLEVKGASFKTPFIESPVDWLDAVASFDGKAGRVEINRMDAGRSDLRGTIEIKDLKEHKVRFELASNRVDTNDLVPRERMRSLARRTLRPPVTGEGTLTVSEGSLWGHGFKGLKAAIEMEKDHVFLRPVSAEIDGGRVDAALSYHRDAEDPVLFEAAVEAASIDVKQMLSAFGAKKDILAGALGCSGVLSAKRGAQPFSSGLDGDFKLKASDGRLWKFQVMAGIFSVINIVSIDELFEEGLPFKTLSGGFTIKDGVVSTGDMNLDSSSMRMSATGEIDLPQGRINGILALHPLVTIDKIVSSIPLAGYIITGKNESTASIYYSIDGPLKRPDVSLLPVKSVEEGVLGILERLIKTPIRLLEKEENK